MENLVPETVGGRIKAVRKALGKTQEEFCDNKTGLTRSKLAKFELDLVQDYDQLFLLKICEYYHTTMDYLLEGKLPMFPDRSESDRIIDFCNELIGPNPDPLLRRLVVALSKLDATERAALRHIADEIRGQEEAERASSKTE